MDWSDDELRAGLEAAVESELRSDPAFSPAGVDRTHRTELFRSLSAKGWVTATVGESSDGVIRMFHDVRITPDGRAALDSLRSLPNELPDSPSDAWALLTAEAEPLSPFAREIRSAQGDLERRGVFNSGMSTQRALEIGYDHNLTWSGKDQRFIRRATSADGASAPPDNPNPRAVLVAYGRDNQAKTALFAILSAIDLMPMEWEDMVALTGTGSPYPGDVLKRGFLEAMATVVLFTPDDEARLHVDLRNTADPIHETELTCQPRPNVLIEAGMALAMQPDRTIVAQVGEIRPATDLVGRHVIHLGRTGSLKALARRLKTAGCPIDLDSALLENDERFYKLEARTRTV